MEKISPVKAMIWSQNLHNSLHYSVLTRISSLSIKVVTIWLVWATSESIRTLSKFSSLCCGSRHLVPDLTQEWLRCQYFIQCSKNIFLRQHSCSEPIFTFVHQLSFIIRNMILEPPLWRVSWWTVENLKYLPTTSWLELLGWVGIEKFAHDFLLSFQNVEDVETEQNSMLDRWDGK